MDVRVKSINRPWHVYTLLALRFLLIKDCCEIIRAVVLRQDKVESKGELNCEKMVLRGGMDLPTREFSVRHVTDSLVE
jgi:hypothetical protein